MCIRCGGGSYTAFLFCTVYLVTVERGRGRGVVAQLACDGSWVMLLWVLHRPPTLYPRAVIVALRWNCCIALGVLLCAPGLQARVTCASWSRVLMRSLHRYVGAGEGRVACAKAWEAAMVYRYDMRGVFCAELVSAGEHSSHPDGRQAKADTLARALSNTFPIINVIFSSSGRA